ncbi:MAG: ABC transporter permease [bacterium]|nr:ABC transporter permease [bacterium]
MTQPLRTFLARSPGVGAGTGFLAVFLFFAFITPETFLSHRSFSSILNSQAVPGIAAVGITLLMISGEFDLSVGSILGVSSLTFLYATVNGIHILIAMCLGLFTGCLLGLINGLLLIWTGIPSFIVTLGTMLVFRAISLTSISGGRIVRYADYSRDSPAIHVPYWMLVLSCLGLCVLIAWMSYGAVQTRLSSIKRGLGLERFRSGLVVLILCLPIVLALYLLSVTLTHSAGFRVPFFNFLNGRFASGTFLQNYRSAIFWWLTLTFLFAIILTRTRYGNAVFAIGGNAEAARLQGIHINRIRVSNFVISGGLAALAGIFQVARLKSVDPLRGEGLELEVIAAVVIGGTLLTGGYGSMAGSAIGTALTGMLRTGLVLIHVPSNAFRGAIGAMMIVAVIINTLVRKER